MSKLPQSFYQQEDVVDLARKLIGKVLVTNFNDERTSGIISETEAYNGIVDRASHAFSGRRTARTEMMYGEGGIAYVYLCYGIHHLFNVVTNRKDVPHAILIRNILPLEGIDIMEQRRNCKGKLRLSGPGTLSQALGITTEHNGISLDQDLIWIEEPKRSEDLNIQSGPRIGIDYAGEDAKLKYRFILV